MRKLRHRGVTILVTRLLSHSTGIHFQAACLLILLSLLLRLLPPSASPLHSLNSVFQFILTSSIMNMYGSCVQSLTVHHFTLPVSWLCSSGKLYSKMSWKAFHASFSVQFSSVQFSHSVMSDSVTPRIVARQASLSITNSRSLLKLMSTGSVMPSNHLILHCPLFLPPSVFPSIRVFSNVSSLYQMAKVLEFQLQHYPSNDYSGLISFRMDCLDLLAVQGILKSSFYFLSKIL